ncbi:B12-binding domain-containing radical SAM protein [Elusimicrobiota bacterium]
MKIMIAYPPLPTDKGVPLLSQNRQFQYFSNPTYIYPMLPAYAATMLKNMGHDVAWADAIASEKSDKEFINDLMDFKPDMVAIEAKTPVIGQYWRWIDSLKAMSPKTRFVLMGDHVTALPEESMENSKADFVLCGGDFDFGLANIADHMAKNADLDHGVYFREENGSIGNTGPFKQRDLKGVLPIDRDLTQWELYAHKNGNFKYLPGAYTMIGRDCWWRTGGGCTFCSWTNTFKSFRVGTPESLLDEIEMLVSKYGIREVFDDTGTFPIGGWLKKFCNGMIERGLNKRVKIGCNMRPGALSQEEYDLMGKAGFRFVLYGLESANKATLDRINKGHKEHAMAETARMAKQAGLEPHATCMVGYPWESRDEAMATIEMTKDLFRRGWINTLQATIVIPYPGTRLFKECEDNDWLKTRDWARYDMREPVMKCPMPDDEVMGLTQGLYRSFITPKFIMKKLVSIRSVDDIRFFYRAGKAVVGHLSDFNKKQACGNKPEGADKETVIRG